MIKAIAFESNENKGCYAPDGVEKVFEGGEDGNVTKLAKAFLVIRDDFDKPTNSPTNLFSKII
ncbi:hypothetical protein KHA94_02020 [Bacillus sp. FJAT-49705]|uniref:Uncharacterized protein n=1 Tax=Cytobacillus citreus TaxID=2833586 RepID=A0ABS5NNL6_9BACI|nr:hypothetical protein [Cytobacillus citreus]MBS4188993.1 hypothetical protein [Cytobacillus citreus]